MNLHQEIKRLFATTQMNSAAKIHALTSPFDAWVVRMSSEYGVGVPIAEGIEVSERFAGARLRTESLKIEGEPYRLLILSSDIENLRSEFSTICAQFVDPGEEGIDRRDLLESPIHWWERWRALLGNSISDLQPYSVLGELHTLRYLLKNGQIPIWTGPKGGVTDVSTDSNEYEVKSTTMRYESEVSISGQFQLSHSRKKPLRLIFCRFERSSAGQSINQLAAELKSLGMDASQIEHGLIRLGYETGASARNEAFTLMEMRSYEIDDDFPGITLKSFVGGKLPDAVKQLTYRLDLTGITFRSLMA